jgi:hypothetical protein
MNTQPQRRLYLYFATENDRAVILLRAARRLWAMILWDRAAGTFTEGQWLKREIDPALCQISPDGRHFLYNVRYNRPNDAATESYTAISRPPYFTALALFAQGWIPGWGGCFLDNGHYWIDGLPGPEAQRVGKTPDLARVIEGTPAKGCTTGLRLTDGRPAPLARDAARRLVALLPKAGQRGCPPGLMWLWRQALAGEQDAIHARYDTLGGRLYRRDGMELALIRDFDELQFRPVRAPYDDRPRGGREPPAPWHPLDGEA